MTAGDGNGDSNGNGNGYRSAQSLARLEVRVDHLEQSDKRIEASINAIKSMAWYVIGAVMLMVITTVLVKTGVVLQ